MKRLIIDGNNLVHRAYWVSKNQANFNEHFHIYLFLNSVKTYVKKYEPEVVFCAWDEKADYQVNKRKTMLEGYKSTRDSEKNKDVHTLNYIIKEFLTHLGINSVQPYAYEADDVIAIFADKYKSDEKIIVTVDRDLCQLIDDKTKVYDPIRKTEFNYKNFQELLGYNKKDFVLVKALAGDKSDNIPGLKGFGKVKIAKVLNGEYLLSKEEQALLEQNLKLVDLSLTLTDNQEVQYVIEQLNKPQQYDFEAFKLKCKDFKFNDILNKQSDWFNTFFLHTLIQKQIQTDLLGLVS